MHRQLHTMCHCEKNENNDRNEKSDRHPQKTDERSQNVKFDRPTEGLVLAHLQGENENPGAGIREGG